LYLGAPPKMHDEVIQIEDPKFRHSEWICYASSLVGARIKAIGPSPYF